MKLIVGLGNPGIEYENTRHNLGFMAIDAYCYFHNVTSFKKGFNGIYGKFKNNNEDIILFKPLTYMNLSGIAVKEIIDFYKIDLNDIVVIYDDKDIPFSSLRLREKGNPGSHNGMKSITSMLNSTSFKRIRIGMGSPINNSDMINFVLSKFKKEELDVLKDTFNNLNLALDLFINNDYSKAMNMYNFKKDERSA